VLQTETEEAILREASIISMDHAMLELDIKNQESSPMKSSDLDSMSHMEERSRLFPETDTALVTRNPT
jgi:hypothetical protein